MGFEIVTIPCLSDNYAYLIVRGDKACVVDVPEAAPIVEAVRETGFDGLACLELPRHAHDPVSTARRARDFFNGLGV